MATPEVMKYFNSSLKTELIVDASPVGLGAILTQVTADGGTNIVAYASRSLTELSDNNSGFLGPKCYFVLCNVHDFWRYGLPSLPVFIKRNWQV